jgi:hypothetical protein
MHAIACVFIHSVTSIPGIILPGEYLTKFAQKCRFLFIVGVKYINMNETSSSILVGNNLSRLCQVSLKHIKGFKYTQKFFFLKLGWV